MSISNPAVAGERRPNEQVRREVAIAQTAGRVMQPARAYPGSALRFRFAVGFGYAAIFLSIMVASFPAAELVFRLLGDEPSFDLRGLYAPFANGNYKLAPEVQTSARFASGPLSVNTDAFGLRCDKAKRFAANRRQPIDILLIGDSQGFGNGVNFEDTIGGSMATLAAEQGYRVSNASVGGHSLASQLQLARWLIEGQGLKVQNFVLLLTPAMIHSPDKLNQAIVGEDGRLYGAPTVGARLRRWAKSDLVVYSRVRDAVRNLGIGADPTEGSSTVFSLYDAGHDQATADEALLATVGEFKDFATTHGAAIHMVYVPLTVEATFESVRQVAARQNISLDVDVSFNIAAAVAKRLGIPLHDLRPVLQRAHSDRQVLIVKGDFHYSPILSRACGARLWAELSMAPRKNNQVNANRPN